MTDFSERRRTIRISVNGTLTVEAVPPGQALRLVDVGMGGFCAQSSAPVPLNVATTYRFSTPDGKWTVDLSARAVHSKLQPPNGNFKYVTGFSFLRADAPDVQRMVLELMDHATDMSFS